MKKYMYVVAFAALCTVFVWYHAANAAPLVDETSVLNGTVTWTAQAGTAVKQGSTLVNISTLTGDTSACRASADGTVAEVLVKPGSTIKPGEVVARLQPAH